MRPTSDPPDPLKHFQAVSADLDSMKDFLRKFFGSSEITGVDPPINVPFAADEESVTSLAQKICELVAPSSPLLPEEAVYYNRRIKITVDPAKVSESKIPDDSEVESDRSSLEVFDLVGKPPGGECWQWGNIEGLMRDQEDSAWIDELAQSVDRACQGLGLRPINSKLKSLTSGKIYRPNLSKRENRPDGTMTLEVLLIQQPMGEAVMKPVKRRLDQPASAAEPPQS